MRHRHLDVDPAIPPAELGLAALDDLLDRGDLADWAPVLREVRREPAGPVAERVLQLVEHHPMAGTSVLWRSWIEGLRERRPGLHAGRALRRLRLGREVTQAQLASKLGMTQPEVSKLERRGNVRLSTMLGYVEALGGRLVLTARFDDRSVELGEEGEDGMI